MEGVSVLTSYGRASETGHYLLRIDTGYSMNLNGTEFELNPKQIKSIKFILDNLKKEDSTSPIHFLIGYEFRHNTILPAEILYQHDDTIVWGRKRFTSIEATLRQIVEIDIESKKQDDDEEDD